jgi:amino acid adenylation domain-containing protein/thioester reductase-like protein
MSMLSTSIGTLSPEEKRALLAQRQRKLVGSPRSFPLSFAQQRLWFLDQLLPGSTMYTIPLALRLRGTLEVAILQRSLGEIRRRHAVLRTTFELLAEQPMQVIHPAGEVVLPLIDLALPDGESEAMRLIKNDAELPFDLARGPLLRAILIRLAPEEHILCLTIHHIIFDGWSIDILLHELSALYNAFLARRPSPLADPPIQYVDFAAWQSQQLHGELLEAQLAYWRRQLHGTPVLHIPSDFPRPSLLVASAESKHLTLAPSLQSALVRIGQQVGATLFMTLLATLKLLLARYCGQNDIAVATAVANRSRPEIEHLLGFFVNTLVLRTNLADDPTFREVLQQVRTTCAEAYAHQDLPFEQLVAALQPERHLAQQPLAQTIFALYQQSRQSIVLQGLEVEQVTTEGEAAKYDLAFGADEAADGLRLTITYRSDLFETSTIVRMLDHWHTLVEEIVADPDRHISHLPLLTPAERQVILQAWNDTARPYSDHACIHQLIAAQVARARDAVAVIADDSQLTYEALDRRAAQLASELRDMGVGPEVCVGLCVERSLDLLVGLLGIWKAGGAYVPLDPGYPRDRLALMLEDAGLSLVLTQQALAQRLCEIADGLQPDLACQTQTTSGGPTILCLDADWPLIAQQPTDDPPGLVTPDNLAYVIYTSGSTGKPKGTLLPHRGLSSLSEAQRQAFGVQPGQTMLQFSSPNFDASIFEIVMALGAGARLCIAAGDARLPGPALARLLRDQGVGIVTLTPSTLAALPPDDLPSLRTITVAGEACPAELVERWSSGRRFFNLYGPTEATIWTTAAECLAGETPDIGRPIANTQVYILDQHSQPTPVGVSGELYIGGIGLARGYLGRPALTAERFVPDPFSLVPGARLYRSGDRARYRPNGAIEFQGRIDQQVKVRGFRIEPGEIEAALLAHPQIGEAVVVARVDRAGEHQLVAYIVPQIEDSGSKIGDSQAPEMRSSIPFPAPSELRSFLLHQLPAYLVPNIFVVLEALPLSLSGKVDRRALPEPEATATLPAAYHGPQTQTEETIAGVWQELLQLDRIDRDANFFDLGGHSLLLTRVHTRLSEIFGASLTLLDMFQYPTVSALAAFLEPGLSARPASQPQPTDLPHYDRQYRASDIAIIGMVGRFEHATTLEQFWHSLRDGTELITFFSAQELLSTGLDPAIVNHPNYVLAGGYMPDIDLFDAAFFDITPREAAQTDPQHRLFLECAWGALENAGYTPTTYQGRIGVYAGASSNRYSDHAEIPLMHDNMLGLIGSHHDHLPMRVSYKLDLKGPSVNVQTTCSTSLVAVHLACRSLQAGDCDIALAGGVSIQFLQKSGYFYQEGGVQSPDGHCRTFDSSAQGTVGGSGVGIVVLKPLEAALADGDCIHAVIRGSAINNDGARRINYTAPSIDGQAAVISAALAQAGVTPDTLGYVEAHGTGTALGDPIEIAGLTKAFRAHTAQAGFCAVGSVKSNIGHLDSAAGIAGLMKVALALKHRQIPPSLHFRSPNPQIDFATSPFYVNTALRDWPANGTPRRAGISSFGVGSTNAHVILEEAPIVADASPARRWKLLLLSAKTAGALDTMAANLATYLQQHPCANLADVAYTLQVGRAAFRQRRMLVCTDHEDALGALAGEANGQVQIATTAVHNPPIVFMFPGQGSQFVAMAAGLYRHEPVFRANVDYCADVLRPHLGLDLRAVLYPDELRMEDHESAILHPPSSILDQTALAQPALFVVEYALAQLWMHWGLQPQALIGHSLGEYVAACLAGVIALEDALPLIAFRGRLMDALPGGAMVAVPLSEQEILPLLGEQLNLAAVNGPKLCVLSGPADAVADITAQLAAQGIETRRLHTSHAFHSALMEPILEPFAAQLGQIALHPPRIPFVSSRTGTWITADEATDPCYWAQQLRQPVQFAAGVQALLHIHDRVLLEVGPGHSLGTLCRQQIAGAKVAVVASLSGPRDAEPDEKAILTAIGQLWLAGVSIDWSRLYCDEQRRRLPLPTYPFERQRYWIEPRALRLASNGTAEPQPQLRGQAPQQVIIEEPVAYASELNDRQTAYLAPRNEREQMIVGIWQQLLGIETIGVFDNFFELGGYSLLLPQLQQQLKAVLQVDISIRQLVIHATVAEIAELIGDSASDGQTAAITNSGPIDLAEEIVLDASILLPGKAAAIGRESPDVLLTGASGFLGAFLLYELLVQTPGDVYCLVRAASAEAAMQRIERTMAGYQIWRAEFAARIKPLIGDLAKPSLGMDDATFQATAQRVGQIYHCGAWVNFTYPYSALKAANVQSIQEVLRLACCGHVKPVHFVSSLVVFSSSAYGQVFYEDDPLLHSTGFTTSYGETKWVAEKIIALGRARGIPVTIYRPGVIGGHSITGAGNAKDMIWALIKGCIQLGVGPDTASLMDIAPVDYVSKGIVHLAQQPASLGRNFHLAHPAPVSWRELVGMIQQCGYPIRLVGHDEWRATLGLISGDPSNALYPFKETLLRMAAQGPEETGHAPIPDCTNTLQELAGSGISCPTIDHDLVQTWMAYLIGSGFVEPAPELALI